MLLLFDAFTDHNPNGSPTPWQHKYLSTEKEVKFGKKSVSNLFQENQKILIHFCMTQREDIAWTFFGNKSTNQIGWPCKKIDRIWTTSVRYFKQFTDGGIILPITIMWIVKRQCGFIILSYSNFSIPSTKML
jgi:hypothetical protein